MRSICCSLLDLKGCVSLQWQRVRREGQWRWQVAYKVSDKLCTTGSN
jgi:hypothetical protein